MTITAVCSVQQNITRFESLSYVIYCTKYSQWCIADIHFGDSKVTVLSWLQSISDPFDDTAVNVLS